MKSNNPKTFDFAYTMNKQMIIIPSGIGLTTVLIG